MSLRTNHGIKAEAAVKDKACDFKEDGGVKFDDLGNVKEENMKPAPHKSRDSRQFAKQHQRPPLFCDFDDLGNDTTTKPSAMKKCRTVKVGAIFDDKKSLITQFHRISVIQKFDFNILTSTKKLFIANVLFLIVHGGFVRRLCQFHKSPEFKVWIYIESHTCSAVYRYKHHRQANAKCIGKMYVDSGHDGDDLKGITPKHIMNCIKSLHGLDIGYTKAHSALSYARMLVRGTSDSGYQDLPSYLYKIEQANPCTIIKLERDDEERFKYFFIAFGACIKGFELLRRVVVVDGAYLTGKFRGVMLVVVGQDANSNIFLITFGIVDIENDASWECLFTQLRGVIRDDKNLAIIFDRHPSIANAIEKVFPAANRRVCYYHLKHNLILKFNKKAMLSLVCSVAYEYRVTEFEKVFDVIRRQNSELVDYLENADFRLWACAHFSEDRFGEMTSNIAESINGMLKEDRSFPIKHFVEGIRKLLSRWFVERREKAASLKTNFPPKVELLLHDRNDNMENLNVQHLDQNRSHVTDGEYACTVDLRERTCTCRQYDVEKILCEHAIKAARSLKTDEATLVDDHFTKGYYFSTYLEALDPVGEYLILPPQIISERCLPPVIKVHAGRLKMKRYLSVIEKAKRFKRNQWKKNKTEPSQKTKKKTKQSNKKKVKQSTKKERNEAEYSIHR